jgi:hypothetical protein
LQDKRIPLAVYVSQHVAQMAVEAARQSDKTQSGYLRATPVRQLRSDGFDLASRRFRHDGLCDTWFQSPPMSDDRLKSGCRLNAARPPTITSVSVQPMT